MHTFACGAGFAFGIWLAYYAIPFVLRRIQ